MIECNCPECRGKRLRPEYRAVTVGGINISDLTDLSVKKSIEFLENFI